MSLLHFAHPTDIILLQGTHPFLREVMPCGYTIWLNVVVKRWHLDSTSWSAISEATNSASDFSLLVPDLRQFTGREIKTENRESAILHLLFELISLRPLDIALSKTSTILSIG